LRSLTVGEISEMELTVQTLSPGSRELPLVRSMWVVVDIIRDEVDGVKNEATRNERSMRLVTMPLDQNLYWHF